MEILNRNNEEEFAFFCFEGNLKHYRKWCEKNGYSGYEDINGTINASDEIIKKYMFEIKNGIVT